MTIGKGLSSSALPVSAVVLSEDLPRRGQEIGRYLGMSLLALKDKYDTVGDARFWNLAPGLVISKTTMRGSCRKTGRPTSPLTAPSTLS
jgi:4-aminobutyrate aminotransferase-like enzyme